MDKENFNTVCQIRGEIMTNNINLLEIDKMPEFSIACCETCGLIISDNLKGGNNKNKILQEFKEKYDLNNSTDEIFVFIKNLFHEKLANDKYGVNNLKQVDYESK
jgi:hypothetical protein